MMRAALYARVSTDEQVEGYSIDAQLRAGRDFASAKEWIIINEYVDEGKSARAEDIARRPRFQEMLRAANEREFEVLIVHKLDRFSRNLLVTLRSFDELSKRGITFISITEQIDFTTPMGRVFLAWLVHLPNSILTTLVKKLRKIGRKERHEVCTVARYLLVQLKMKIVYQPQI